MKRNGYILIFAVALLSVALLLGGCAKEDDDKLNKPVSPLPTTQPVSTPELATPDMLTSPGLTSPDTSPAGSPENPSTSPSSEEKKAEGEFIGLKNDSGIEVDVDGEVMTFTMTDVQAELEKAKVVEGDIVEVTYTVNATEQNMVVGIKKKE